MRCILVGNYGVGNLGDEALKDYFLSAFPEVVWKVIMPSERLPAGIRSFFLFRWLKTIKAFRQADAIVFGGGSLFTDAESPHACVVWGIHALAAWMFRKPIFLAFQGVGPFRTRLGEGIARWVCRHAAFISVRDHESAKRLSLWNLSTEVIQTSDPVFLAFRSYKFDSSTQKILTIIPRKNSGAMLQKMAEKVLQEQNFDRVEIVLMQPDDLEEGNIAQSLQELCGGSIVEVRQLPELMEAVGRANLVVTERFHGALAALALDKEVLICSQKPGDKLSALSDAISQDRAGEIRRMEEGAKKGEEALRQMLQKC